MSSSIGSTCLGASTFCAQQHGAEECDCKGLPLTPHSINIVGRFQSLLDLDHPGLCAYLDIKRSRNGEPSHSYQLCILKACNDTVSLPFHVLSHSDVLVPERLIVVSEWYEDSVERHIQSKTFNE